MMKKIVTFSIFLLLPFTVFAESSEAKQIGDISIQLGEKKGNTYEDFQTEVLGYFKKLSEDISADVKNPGALSDGAMNYLTAAYLYCTLQSGTCILPLEGLLESDLIESKLSGKVECPRLSKFWKLWIGNDMEKRQGILGKTAFMNATSQFTKDTRPQFLKCKETITSEFDKDKSDAKSFFGARYSDGKKKERFQKLAELIELIKNKIPNLFAELQIVPNAAKSN